MKSEICTRATQPCELVHVDLWGPSPVRSHTGNKYLIIFTDDYSRYSALYALSKKMLFRTNHSKTRLCLAASNSLS